MCSKAKLDTRMKERMKFWFSFLKMYGKVLIPLLFAEMLKILRYSSGYAFREKIFGCVKIRVKFPPSLLLFETILSPHLSAYMYFFTEVHFFPHHLSMHVQKTFLHCPPLDVLACKILAISGDGWLSFQPILQCITDDCWYTTVQY